MVVTWVTQDSVVDSVVEYGVGNLDTFQNGTVESFLDGGPKQRTMFMHRTVASGLKPGQKYSECLRIRFSHFRFLLLLMPLSHSG